MFAAALLLAAAVVAPPPATPPPPLEPVRIAVGRFPSEVQIDGAAMVLRAPDGTTRPLGPSVKARVQRQGQKAAVLVIDGAATTLDRAIVDAPGTLRLQKHGYRRELELQARVYKGKAELLVVHPLDLETYVAGIVSAELPQGWPLEAYKAQAVAARTFAVHQKYRRLDLPYHMESSVLDQVYAGVDREHPLAHQAVQETRGLVLTHKRHLAQAFFHAACGGKTESAREGWGTPLSYLPGSTCGHCAGASRHTWSARVPKASVDKAFARLLGEPLVSLTVTSRTATGRVKTLVAKGAKRQATLSGPDLRRLVGYSVIWSTQIDELSVSSGALVVKGRGTGHGVGMCQWGAHGLAQKGVGYVDILRRYYPGAALQRLY